MSGCEDIRELMSGRLDGVLTGDEARRLEEHLSACPGCRRQLAALERAWELLGALRPIEPASDLAERVLRRALTFRRGQSRRVVAPRWLYTAAAAAVVLAAVTAGYWLFSRPATGPEIEPTPVAETPAPENTAETQQIVRNMDLLENLEVLEQLDIWTRMGDKVLLLPEETTSTTTDGAPGGES